VRLDSVNTSAFRAAPRRSASLNAKIQSQKESLSFGVVSDRNGQLSELLQVGYLALDGDSVICTKRFSGFFLRPLFCSLVQSLIILIEFLFQ